MNLKKLINYIDSTENSRKLAELWSDYVDWKGRRKGEDGFLLDQLGKYNVHKVLDVALGDGADSIYLLQQGFNVSGNEIDDAFREKAIENAKKLGFSIEPTNLDWRNLSKSYSQNSLGSIICLGNSLTFLFGRENQAQSLKQFCSLLKPGGVLLIDERNYQKILNEKNSYLSGSKHLTGRYLYTGKKIDARWIEINDDFAIAQLIHKQTGNKAYSRVHPFRKGELMEILREAGFKKIEQYGDYEPGENPDADFYQYICIK